MVYHVKCLAKVDLQEYCSVWLGREFLIETIGDLLVKVTKSRDGRMLFAKTVLENWDI